MAARRASKAASKAARSPARGAAKRPAAAAARKRAAPTGSTRKLTRPGAATAPARIKSRPPAPPRSLDAPSTLAPYATRISRVLHLARERGADAVLITNPLDVGYLTGFLGGDSYLLIGQGVSPEGAVIISDGRYEEELAPQASLCDIVIRKGSMPRAVADALTGPGIRLCAVQADHLTIAGLDELERVVGLDSGSRFVAVNDLVLRFRIIKDAHECELMAAAIALQEDALAATLPQIAPGQTELEIAAILESEMKRRGSSKPGFESIVAAGPNGSLPHHRPGSAKVAANQPLLIDWGATFMGYQGDMTRTFTVGKWPAKMREIYEIVRDAQQLAAAALEPGRSTHEIDAIARNHISRHGYGDRFDHGLGHGLGLGKEPPYLNPKYASMELRPGHVCTIEPGIYLPGVGGVRIEDQYVITDSGARNFCSLPKSLEWSTL